jgi:sporulation protein YlmC with PRC-barrel domain
VNLYRTEELLNIPIINVQDAHKLGEVSSIRISLQEGNVFSYEFAQKVPLENAVMEENVEEIPSGNHYSVETAQIPKPTLHHTPHATIAGPSTGAEWAYQEVKHVYELEANHVHALSNDALLTKNNEYQKSEDRVEHQIDLF